MRHIIDAARSPGVAAKDAPRAQRRSADHPVLLDRFECVARARRVVPANIAVQGRDPRAVAAQNNHRAIAREEQQEGGRSLYRRRVAHLSSAPFKHIENFTSQGSPRNPGTTWQRTDNEPRSGGASKHDVVPDRPKPPSDQVAGDRISDGLRHNEPDPGRIGRARARDVEERVRGTHTATFADGSAEVVRGYYPVDALEHEGLGGEFGATLATTCRQDRAAGASAHAKTETVDLCATTIVRLEGSLAHSCISDVQLCMQ
jgi:hypothetical protein